MQASSRHSPPTSVAYELIDRQPQEPPFSSADNYPCRLALFPVPVELEAGRGDASGTCRRLLRNDPSMGPQVRGGLLKAVAKKEAVAKGYLASGRGGDFHCRQETLALASRRPGGYVLDEIVQARRDTRAAKRLLVRLLKKQGLAPKRIVTDKLGSYGAAKRDVMPTVEHRSHKG